MSTTPIITDRLELSKKLKSLVSPGREPQPYTKGVMGVNNLLERNGVPLPPGFGEVAAHNVTMVESRQISSVTGHLREVGPLLNAGVSHFRSGNYAQSAICLSGVVGNMIFAPMLSGSAEKTRRVLGKD